MHESPDPRQLAADKRRERAERIHRLRVRIAAGAVALFIATWTGLYVQLVSGQDPALASGSATVATQSADPEVATSDNSGASGDGSTADTSVDGSTADASGTTWNADGTASDPGAAATDSTQGASSSSSSPQPADVTTGQS